MRLLVNLPETTLTDAAGRFRFDNAPPQEVQLLATRERWARVKSTVSDAQPTRDLKLGEAGWIEGRVVDGQAPAMNAAVEWGDVRAEADAAGKFRIGPLPVGETVELQAISWPKDHISMHGSAKFAVGAKDATIAVTPRLQERN